MKRVSLFVALFLFCLNLSAVYPQQAVVTAPPMVKAVDVNKDGVPDITYHGQGKYVTRAEADTDYDGKTDVVVHVKDGKFESAEVDTDHNGTMDKKFTNSAEFDAWLNKDNPDFRDKLNRADWQFDLIKF